MSNANTSAMLQTQSQSQSQSQSQPQPRGCGPEGFAGRREGFGPVFQNDALPKQFRQWSVTPPSVAESERAAWFEATADPPTSLSATNDRGSPATEHFGPAGGASGPIGESLDYNQALTDLVADPRLLAQHSNWVNEVLPKSQVSMKVDTIDEAAAISAYRGHGIYAFRFNAPAQNNPLFVTDEGPADYHKESTPFLIT